MSTSVRLFQSLWLLPCPTMRTYRAGTSGKSKGCRAVVVPLLWPLKTGLQEFPSVETGTSKV